MGILATTATVIDFDQRHVPTHKELGVARLVASATARIARTHFGTGRSVQTEIEAVSRDEMGKVQQTAVAPDAR